MSYSNGITQIVSAQLHFPCWLINTAHEHMLRQETQKTCGLLSIVCNNAGGFVSENFKRCVLHTGWLLIESVQHNTNKEFNMLT
jgi:hypothetical protein